MAKYSPFPPRKIQKLGYMAKNIRFLNVDNSKFRRKQLWVARIKDICWPDMARRPQVQACDPQNKFQILPSPDDLLTLQTGLPLFLSSVLCFSNLGPLTVPQTHLKLLCLYAFASAILIAPIIPSPSACLNPFFFIGKSYLFFRAQLGCLFFFFFFYKIFSESA